MKKQIVFAFAVMLCGMAAFTSCSKEDNTVNYPYPKIKVLTFEDNDWKGGVNFVGKSDWSSLIDDPQYYGPLLYPSFYKEGDPIYGWYDKGNTKLASELVNAYGDGAYWSGGIAISNYIDADLTHGDYNHQLAVPAGNGSQNFAVVFCNSNPTINPKNPQTTMEFGDGGAYQFKSMLISPTTYQLNVSKNGNGYAKALTKEGDYFTLSIHAMLKGAVVGTIDIDLVRDGKFLEGWQKIDLTSLPACEGLMFTMDSNDAAWGYVNQPTYFAIDDVEVDLQNKK